MSACVRVIRGDPRLGIQCAPRELRPPLYRELLLLLCVCFYGFFSVRVFLELVQG
jgi:hypothetical protein